jgi:oligoribonuclease NrnB/cAMP/cGMP phosphodiesterase (DHH superfamily)
MVPRPPTHVIYHHPCLDGFASAYLLWDTYRRPERDIIEFLPMTAGGAIPDVPDTARVLMVDVSSTRANIEALHARVRDLQVLDHHKTAEAELRGLPYARFDMTRSGVGLTWEWLVGEANLPIPKVYACIEDRDLWRFAIPSSEAITASLQSYPKTFEAWREAMGRVSALESEGRALIRARESWVESAMSRVAVHPVFAQSGAVFGVPVINATDHQSEVCHAILQRNPDVPFVASYLDKGHQRVWSLRARTPGRDVGAIAQVWGGGGHRAAAGFTTDASVYNLGALARVPDALLTP